jgi:predicted  nucleic acid-binding Zn-ribbon protein
MGNRLVEMSEKLQDIRLNEYRAKRQADELEERVKYLTNLLKGKNDAVASLEEKAAKYEADLGREKENFRQREIERTRQFFYKGGSNQFEAKDPTQAKDPRKALIRAASLTTDNK